MVRPLFCGTFSGNNHSLIETIETTETTSIRLGFWETWHGGYWLGVISTALGFVTTFLAFFAWQRWP